MNANTVALLIAFLLASCVSVADVPNDANDVRPLLPGTSVPDFQLQELYGEILQVQPAALSKPVVLTFYRGGWCPYCVLHLSELRTVESDLRELGFEVWFVSPDRPELLAEGDHSEHGYRLLSDADGSAMKAFGVAFRLDEATHERYQGFGVDINERSGESSQLLPVASSFLIGTDGVIQFMYANPDYKVRLAPAVLLAAAQAHVEHTHRRLLRSSD